MTHLITLLLFLATLGFAAAPWQVTNPEGNLKMTVYQRAGDSAVVRINYGRDNLAMDATMRIGFSEYKVESQSYYVVVPAYMKQKLTIWRKDDPGNRIELLIPSLEPKRLIEFNISEQTVNTAKGEGKGKWSLTTTPPGARFQVDGLPISGVTPVGEQEYNVQTYKVLLTKDRYKPTEVLVDVQKDVITAKTILLEPNWGDYEFTVNTSASIDISGKVFEFSPQAPLKLEGEANGLDARRHNYRVSAPGYLSIDDFIEAQAGEKRVIPIQLQFQQGRVDFVSIPDNSQVLVNGEVWGSTPFTRENIPAGTYQAQFLREGYAPRLATINVDRWQQEIKINLALTSGNLRIDAEPQSQVTLDGKLMSKGLLEFRNLDIKNHSLLVQHPDFEDWNGEISVFEENQFFSIPQKPKNATLWVEGNQIGAEVSIDGVVIGQTPLQGIPYPANKSSVSLRIAKPGFTVVDSLIVLGPNQQVHVQFALEDIEERNRREASYAQFEQTTPIELGIRQGSNGQWQIGFRQGNFVWRRGLHLMDDWQYFGETYVGIDTTGGRVDGIDLRITALEKRYGLQLKTLGSFLVARAGISALFAPTLHFDTDQNSTPNLSWKLDEGDNYDIYMNKGIAIDLLAVQAMLGINIHPAFGNIYAQVGLFGGILVPSSVNALLHSNLDTNALSSADKEEMQASLADARENMHPYFYPSLSLGMNFFISGDAQLFVSAEPYEEWYETMTASLQWGGFNGSYGWGWDVALGRFVYTEGGFGSGWTIDLLPMRWLENSFGMWLGKAGYALQSNWLFFNAELSASVGYGWTWDLPKSFAEEMYGLSQEDLVDSLSSKIGYSNPQNLKVEGTKYAEIRFGLSKRVLENWELFADLSTEFGSWNYLTKDQEENNGLDSKWAFTPPALAIGIKYSAVTKASED